MHTLKKRKLLIAFCLIFFSSLTCTTYAEKIEDIIDAQKELKKTSERKEKQLSTQEKLLTKSKDGIAMGKEEYQRTCSLCHGIDAKGHGVYAFELKDAPADLTLIKKRIMVFFHLAGYIKLLTVEKKLSPMEHEICQFGETDIVQKAGCIPMREIQKLLSEGRYLNYYFILKLYKNSFVLK